MTAMKTRHPCSNGLWIKIGFGKAEVFRFCNLIVLKNLVWLFSSVLIHNHFTNLRRFYINMNFNFKLFSSYYSLNGNPHITEQLVNILALYICWKLWHWCISFWEEKHVGFILIFKWFTVKIQIILLLFCFPIIIFILSSLHSNLVN